jgi:proline racemase
VRAVEQLRFGVHDAIVPEVSGCAALTGRSEFWLDPADTLGGGFLLR